MLAPFLSEHIKCYIYVQNPPEQKTFLCLDQLRIAARNKRTKNTLLPLYGTVTARTL